MLIRIDISKQYKMLPSIDTDFVPISAIISPKALDRLELTYS